MIPRASVTLTKAGQSKWVPTTWKQDWYRHYLEKQSRPSAWLIQLFLNLRLQPGYWKVLWSFYFNIEIQGVQLMLYDLLSLLSYEVVKSLEGITFQDSFAMHVHKPIVAFHHGSTHFGHFVFHPTSAEKPSTPRKLQVENGVRFSTSFFHVKWISDKAKLCQTMFKVINNMWTETILHNSGGTNIFLFCSWAVQDLFHQQYYILNYLLLWTLFDKVS